MSAWAIGLVTFACVCGGVLLGIALQRILPEHHLSDDSKDVIKLVTGLLATLSALVLGLLVASAKSSFDAVNDGFKDAAARVILVDRLLADYGPETRETRAFMRSAVAERVQTLFSGESTAGGTAGGLQAGRGIEAVQAKVRALAPANDTQRALRDRALQVLDDLAQARWMGYERTQSATPPAFLVVLVAWLAMMFAAFGLFAPRHATAICALLIGALAMSTTIFLIEEMNHPLDGVIAVSSAPMHDALAVLGK